MSEFDQWMTEVDAEVLGTAGVSVHDLADQPFRAWWDDGLSPTEAAELSLESEGWTP
jgi:hypothetical protein